MAPLTPPPAHHRHQSAANSSSNNHSAGAQSLQVITLDVPNPEWQTAGSDQASRVNASLSFNFLTSFDITTLSTDGAGNGNDITGLLYTPDLDPHDLCLNASAAWVPKNVTRQANLPAQDYDLIGLAPWISPQCAYSYMLSARADPIRALVFFPADNSTVTPPDPSDPYWDLGDGGDWKHDNGFPVYAIPGQAGELLLQESALYSGNMTQVPFGHDLVEFFDPRDYVRLYVDINTGSGNSLPSLWVFLLVVLGILLAIIGLTSLSMHWLQRRRRSSLRRRVASGEVDLEALGIKRLTVPQDLLNEMPLYIYGSGRPVPQPSQKDASVAEEKLAGPDQSASDISSSRPAVVVRTSSYRPTPLSQPTCAICLDDFVPAGTDSEGTTVRELPCHHIFHPECVDTFLRDSSSLCPMCKKTALPKGYCPKVITNAMVRRERMVRQIRERITDDGDHDTEHGDPLSRRSRMRTLSGFSQFRRPTRTTSQQMQQMSHQSSPATATSAVPLRGNSSTISSATPPVQVQPPSTPGRREWARQRAVEMLGQRAPADPETDENRVPAWRKAMRGLFPRR